MVTSSNDFSFVSNSASGTATFGGVANTNVEIIGIRDFYRKFKIKVNLTFANRTSSDLDISYFRLMFLKPGTEDDDPLDFTANGNVHETYRLDYPFGANAGHTNHYERSPRINWNGDGNLDDKFWLVDAQYTKALNWIKIKSSANGSISKFESEGGDSNGGNNTAGPDIELDITDLNLIVASDVNTIPVRIQAIGTHNQQIHAEVNRDLKIPPAFSLGTVSSVDTFHTHNTLNHKITWNPNNPAGNATLSPFHNIRFRIERVTSNGSGGFNRVDGTSIHEGYWMGSTAEADIRTRNNGIAGTKTINLINDDLFPDGVYTGGTEHTFRILTTVLDSEGNSLSSGQDVSKVHNRTTIVFPALFSRPFTKLTGGSAADSTDDMYCAIDTSGDIRTGLRYQTYFENTATSNGFDLTSHSSFNSFTASIDINTGLSFDNFLENISLDKNDIGFGSGNGNELIYCHHRTGMPYGYMGFDINYEFTPQYQAKNGNITVKSNFIGSTETRARFTPICPKHLYPYDSNEFSFMQILHGTVENFFGKATTDAIQFIIKNDTTGSGASDTVNFTNNNSNYSYSADITERVINSIDPSNINTTKSVSGIKNHERDVSTTMFEWDALISDEAWYISRLEFDINFFYRAPSGTDYSTWKTRFADKGITLLNSNQEVNFGSFQKTTDGFSYYYTEIKDIKGEAFAANYDGVAMNKPGTRIVDLIPDSVELIQVFGGPLSEHKIKIFYPSNKDPASYPYTNSIPSFAVAIQTEYKNNSLVNKDSNMVVYTANSQTGKASFLGFGDGVNGNSQSVASKNGLLSNRNNLGSLKNLKSGTENGQHFREFDIELNYEDSKFGYDGGFDAGNQIKHNVYFYIEEFVDSVYLEAWDILFDNLDMILSDHGLNNIVFLDNIDGAGTGGFSLPANFLHPNGTIHYAKWRELATNVLTKTLSTSLANFLHVNTNDDLYDAISFDASLDESAIAKINSSLGYDFTSSTNKRMPFAQSEEYVGFQLIAGHGTGDNEVLINVLDEELDNSQNLNFDLTRQIDLDKQNFDVEEDVRLIIAPKIVTKTSFETGGFEYKSGNVLFRPIGDFNFQDVLGKEFIKNYKDQIVPSFSEIEFIEPVDNTDPDAGPLEVVPQIDVTFKYNKTEFASSDGDYFQVSRENIRINRFIVQDSVDHVPPDESSAIYNNNIYNLTKVNNDATTANFTFDDTFNYTGTENVDPFSDISASGIDTDSLYRYKYVLTPGFVYNPGNVGGNEKIIEFDSTEFQILPANLSLAFSLPHIDEVLYHSKHSQEVNWSYIYGENIDFAREQENEVYFDVYYRIKEDNNTARNGDSIDYPRRELDAIKNLDWILSSSVKWDISNLSLDSNNGEEYSFSQIIKYDEFDYDHRTEIAILLRIEGEFSALSQTLQQHTNKGQNTAGMNVTLSTLEPADFNKKNILLKDEEKISFSSRRHVEDSKQFEVTSGNVTISITRRKSQLRGNKNNPNKPYSSST